MLLELEQGILYGPVNSRRYGRSLGINLMPSEYKFCSFNCVYCHYGHTRVCSMDTASQADRLPALGEVTAALEKALRAKPKLDVITFSGNGEPTLYPQFAELVDEVVRLRDEYLPDARLTLLSNSSGLEREAARRVLDKIDLPMLKLDAGIERTFRAVNRPCRAVSFERIVQRLIELTRKYLQTVFLDGTPSNVTDEELTAYTNLVARIKPVEVHLYSIDRPVPNIRIKLVSPERLEAIAERIRTEAGVPARPFNMKRKD